jgi:hypothetical protein
MAAASVAGHVQTNLVSDLPGMAGHTDLSTQAIDLAYSDAPLDWLDGDLSPRHRQHR